MSYEPDQRAGGTASTADEAKQQAQQVADKARHEAGSVKEAVREEADTVISVAEDQARNLFADAQDLVRQQGDQQVHRLAEGLHMLGDQLTALQEGRTEEAGPLADYLSRFTEQVNDFARRVEDMGPAGILDETRRFARRRPGAFLGSAALAGLVVGRVARSGRDAEQRHRSGDRRVASERRDPEGARQRPTPPPAGTVGSAPPGRTSAATTPPPTGTSGAEGRAPGVVEVNETGTVRTAGESR